MCKFPNSDNYKDAIDYLKISPMFNLSLSSNELFHSNFLYWIWKSNPDAFKKIINGLIGEEDWWKNNCENNSENKQIEVRREYKNFDLSIVEVINNNGGNVAHEDSDAGDYKTDGLILFVLENKVKSIPYAQQLKKYNDKIYEHNKSILKGKIKKKYGTKYWNNDKYGGDLDTEFGNLQLRKVLLSLSDTFPDVKFDKSNQFEGWKRKSYDDYLEILSKLNLKKDFNVYLEDYCKYVVRLIVCVKKWDRFHNLKDDGVPFREYEYLKDAEELRMHAFYYMFNTAKLCCMLINKLSDKLSEKGNVQLQYFGNEDDSILLSDKYKEKYYNYFNNKDILVGVGYEYSHQQPILEVKVAKKTINTGERIFYIIQIQDKSYEHGIIKKCTKDVLKKIIVNYENWVTNIPLRSSDPDIFSSDVLPQEYNGYNATYSMVYKYRKLNDDATVENVLNQIVRDVEELITNLTTNNCFFTNIY